MEDITIDTPLVGYEAESRLVFIGTGESEIAARVTVEYHPLLSTEEKMSEFTNTAAVSLAQVIAKDLSKAKSN